MEYELSFFEFDYNTIKSKIIENGGKLVHKMVPYKVAFFQLCGENDFKSGMIRVRDENGICTMTTKKFSKTSKYPEEYETKVSESYANIVKLLKAGGLELKSEVIKYREKWNYPGCNEIVFDVWAGLPIVMEVECKNEKALHKVCKNLGLDIKNGTSGSKMKHIYGLETTVYNLNFTNYKKLLKPVIKKNQKILNSLTKKYYENFIGKK